MARTMVATGASSGLGFELVKQLLEQAQPYHLILGCRDVKRTQEAYDSIKYDSQKHRLNLLPLELADLKTVKQFAHRTLKELGSTKLDYLLLNAAMIKAASDPGPNGSQWSESYVVNHLSQHYLIALLREKLITSNSRIVVVSSGAIKSVQETDSLASNLKAKSGTGPRQLYPASKFAQLLGALYWRRQLKGSCHVVAVSPGLIPNTGLARHSDFKLTMDMPDAKEVSVGAQSILRAFTRDDFPADPDQIFLTSWGEWWGTDVFPLALDKKIQDEFCPSIEEIEREEHL